MSVSKMKKLTVFAWCEDADTLMRRLVRLRCLDVNTSEAFADGKFSTVRVNCDAQRSALETSVANIDSAMVILNKYSSKKRSMIKPKARINYEEFVANGTADRARETVIRTLECSERLTQIKNEELRLKTLIESALPYLKLDIPLGMSETESTNITLGVLPASIDTDTVGKKLYKAGAIAEILREDNTGKYISVFCFKNDLEAVSAVLSEYGFVKAVFKGVRELPNEYIRKLEKNIADLDAEYDRIHNELLQIADSLENVEALYDLEQTELVAVCNKQKLVSTETSVMLSGWLPEKAESKVEALLDRYACAYELADPDEDDNPPIMLENNGFASNFEWVLGMYSYPMYGKFDPTFIMSIFYFIIFGIMFADAGYGLVLMLACFGGVKLLKPGEGMKRFLLMFGYCGISCVIFGVLFGAYFGDLPIAIMKNMMGMTEAELPNLALLGSEAANVAVLFDPLQNPMGFLIVSLAIGAVHLIAGMAVKFVILCKEGHVFDAIFDIGAYWLLFAGVGLIFVIPAVGKWMTIAAVALIVLTHGRAEKNILMKFLKGLLGLYDLISYISDLLSYSRILALGLAAGVIAQVVNILGTMGGPSVGGFIGLIVAFAVGHLLNIAINVLGTFVHTSRLQYIEFFNKFYEDGGVPFEPAVPSEKYTEE